MHLEIVRKLGFFFLLLIALSACSKRRIQFFSGSNNPPVETCTVTALTGVLERAGTGTLYADKNVSWRLRASGGCKRYKVYRGATLMADVAATVGAQTTIAFVKTGGYPQGTQTEMVSLMAVDAAGQIVSTLPV